MPLPGCGITGGAKIEAPVAVYVSLPLTGPRGVDGREAADGARLALEEAHGRAGSLEVRAHFLDDAKGRPWDAVAVGANARTAVQDHTTAAYIGELDSEPTRASAPITNQAGIVQVSPGAGAVDLTAPAAGYPDSPDRYRPSGDVSFARTVPADDVVVDAAAAWASELGVTAAAVTSDGSLFQNLAAAEFKSAAADHGIRVSPGKPQGNVAVAPAGAARAVYEPGTARLSVYGRTSSDPAAERGARSEAPPRQGLRHAASPSAFTATPAPTPRMGTRRWSWSCRGSARRGRTPRPSATTFATR